MQFLSTNNFKYHFVYKDSLISLKTALGLTVGLSPKAVPFNLWIWYLHIYLTFVIKLQTMLRQVLYVVP